jgi:hypothetical protein
MVLKPMTDLLSSGNKNVIPLPPALAGGIKRVTKMALAKIILLFG